MESNVYEPPRSDIRVPDDKPGSLWKAVGFGALIEIVGSFAVGFLLGLIYVVTLSQQGVGMEEIHERLMHMESTSGIGLFGTLLGCLVSVSAGYVCTAIANTGSYRAALILSAISCSLTALMSYGVHSLMKLLLMSGLTLCCTLGGAWLSKRLKRARDGL